MIASQAVSPPSRLTSAFLFLFSLVGAFASFMLIEAEIELLGDPMASLGCDINPLLACSDSLLTPEAHLLGTSNSIVGLVAFSALTALAAVLVSGARLARWLWWGLGAGTLAGFIYVLYFSYLSLFQFAALCPYCVLAWVATIGAFVVVWANIFAQGLLGASAQKTGRALQRYWALVALAIYLLFVLVIVIVLRDKIMMLL